MYHCGGTYKLTTWYSPFLNRRIPSLRFFEASNFRRVRLNVWCWSSKWSVMIAVRTSTFHSSGTRRASTTSLGWPQHRYIPYQCSLSENVNVLVNPNFTVKINLESIVVRSYSIYPCVLNISGRSRKPIFSCPGCVTPSLTNSHYVWLTQVVSFDTFIRDIYQGYDLSNKKKTFLHSNLPMCLTTYSKLLRCFIVA